MRQTVQKNTVLHLYPGLATQFYQKMSELLNSTYSLIVAIRNIISSMNEMSGMFRPLKKAPLGRCVPWPIRPLEDASNVCAVQTLRDRLPICWDRLGMTVVEANPARHNANILCQVGHLTYPKLACHYKYFDAVQGRDTLVRDGTSNERFDQGTLRPRLFVRRHIGRGRFITSCLILAILYGIGHMKLTICLCFLFSGHEPIYFIEK
jgi:hypothetical protein